MQQQQQGQSMGPMGSVPPGTITTEQIQKYLDENKQLILAILDNQNSGKLAECAQYQALLQKNLLYLAAIADAQPQVSAVRPQMVPHAAMPQGGVQYMQQAPSFPPKTPLQFTPQQIQELQQQQQQQLQHQPQMMSFPGQLGMRPITGMSGMNAATNADSSRVGSTPSSTTKDGGNKQDAGNAASELAAADLSQKNPATELACAEAEDSANRKRLEESKTS